MPWKLFTQNRDVPDTLPLAMNYDTKREAVAAACEVIAYSRHSKVLYIENPTGERIGLPTIEAEYRTRRLHDDTD